MRKKRLAIAAGIFLFIGLVGLVKLTSLVDDSVRTGDSQSSGVKHTWKESLESTKSTETKESSHLQENNQIAFPSLSEERLVLQNGDNLVVLDRYGNICNQFEHATIYFKGEGPNFEFFGNMLLISLENPLPIQVETGDGEYKVGLYSLKENGWMIKPIYEHLNLLSNTVFTTSELLVTSGDLMKTDGSVIMQNVGYCSAKGDYIITSSYVDDNQQVGVSEENSARSIGLIFDLEGNYLSSYDPAVNYMYTAWDDRIIMQNMQTGQTYLQDGYGNVLWAVPWEQWRFYGKYGNYLSWYTAEEEAGVITDQQLNEVMNQEQFFQLNADAVNMSGKLRIYSLEDDNNWIVSITNEEGTTIYYRCDSNFKVVETYDFSTSNGYDYLIPSYLDEITYSWGESAAERFHWSEDESNIYIEDLQANVSFLLAK